MKKGFFVLISIIILIVCSGCNSKKLILPFENFSEGFALVQQGDKYGYIDKTGIVVIPIQYDSAESFKDGVAKVKISEKNETYEAYINTDGNIIFDYRDYLDKYEEVFDCSEGLIGVSTHTENFDTNLTQYGFIDIEGNLKIPLQSEWVISDTTKFSEGLSWVYYNNGDFSSGYYLIDPKGQKLADTAEYEAPANGTISSTSLFQNGYSICYSKTRANASETNTYRTIYIINRQGEVTYVDTYWGTGDIWFNQDDLFLTSNFGNNKANAYSFINSKGEIIIDLSEYDITSITPFYEGYSVAYITGKDGKEYCAYINQSGQFAKEPQSEYRYYSFSEGYALWIKLGGNSNEYPAYIVDSNFNIVSEEITSNDKMYLRNNYLFKDGYCMIDEGSNRYYIDTNGKKLIIGESDDGTNSNEVSVAPESTIESTTEPAAATTEATTAQIATQTTTQSQPIAQASPSETTKTTASTLNLTQPVGQYSNLISCGSSYHVVGLKSDGIVIAAGTNEYGQISVSSWNDIVAVSASTYDTIGLESDGTVVAVGSNEVSGEKIGQCEVSDWENIVAISAGAFHTVGLKSDGTVVAVGLNEIPNGRYIGQCDVSDWKDIKAISAGTFHTVGLKSDGTAIATGLNEDPNDNNVGQCNVSTWSDLKSIVAGSFHTVGLKSDGTVVAVGANSSGQCDVSDWTDIVAVAAGANSTVGLKSDGTVVAVGANSSGQCDVSDWTDIVAVSAGDFFTVGLKKDGTVVAVGNNDYGQCNLSNWHLW